MEQLDLIKPLSQENKDVIIASMRSLIDWRSKEHVPHILHAIEEYYAKLKQLLEIEINEK